MYLELTFDLNSPFDENGEILSAFLTDLAYETVQDNSTLKAYKPGERYSEKTLESELTSLMDLHLCKNDYSQQIIEKTNWNALWESNFNPVEIKGICRIRADFHPAINNGLLEIIITPKMSFGTGHHATTALMIEALDNIDLTNKRCLDMGTGTGILAIYAMKTGASSVLAIDNDEWCATNTLENIAVNEVTEHIHVIHGDAYHLLNEAGFDLIIANINRNILMQDISVYAGKLNPNSQILLSGFHSEDAAMLTNKGKELGLSLLNLTEKDGWVCLHLTKNN